MKQIDPEEIHPAVWVAIGYAVQVNELAYTGDEDKAASLYHAIRYKHALPEYAEGRRYIDEAVVFALHEMRLPLDERRAIRSHLKGKVVEDQ